MTIPMEYILTFGSAHKALKAESILKRSKVPFRLLPAPKPLAPHCALVISVDEFSLQAAKDALAGLLAIKSVYKKEGDDYVEV